MFTGIVEEIGEVKSVARKKNLAAITVKAKKAAKGARPGDSIAVNGVCLTVTKAGGGVLAFEMMRETLLTTTLGRKLAGHAVNLEAALRMDSRLGGHFVTGHIDGVGIVRNLIEQENYTEVVISIPAGLGKFIALKGSVCVDGVSLTVGAVKKGTFAVYLIPFTKTATTFGSIRKGDCVNIEVDILARYVLNSKKAG